MKARFEADNLQGELPQIRTQGAKMASASASRAGRHRSDSSSLNCRGFRFSSSTQ